MKEHEAVDDTTRGVFSAPNRRLLYPAILDGTSNSPSPSEKSIRRRGSTSNDRTRQVSVRGYQATGLPEVAPQRGILPSVCLATVNHKRYLQAHDPDCSTGMHWGYGLSDSTGL